MGRFLSLSLLATVFVAGAAPASAGIEVEFIPSTPAHANAARAYEAIWREFGERIVAALEARTCLPFAESRVAAIIEDASSHSGGPQHPMRLRATYPQDIKRSTLVHELGHRHLWQLVERLEDIDGHRTLYLVLDRVWADVWGDDFALQRIDSESNWKAEYDYAAAWEWVRSLVPGERSSLWNRLLAMNGFTANCAGLE